ncbi:CocE/NonD family hydrolase [Actinomadura sp. J1-007]|uniref:CocE/NonD family hydrolase n=1 Tax=Actinomadura sp. J1-007 TaxID=2661913 RepID=UPI0019D6656C|nr:CocE/NonD family hydrolase [Actinomadura sp. J1-007]
MARPRGGYGRVFAAAAGAAAVVLAVSTAQAARPTVSAARQAGPCAVDKQADVPDRMRDGTVLSADVYRPRTSEKVPVVLMRTQYGKNGPPNQPGRFLSPRGCRPSATSWWSRTCAGSTPRRARSTNSSRI